MRMEHLDPKQAQEFLQKTPDALFIDCRSEMEYLFVGQVKKLAGANHAVRPIILICRSGNRSQEAGEELERHGFSRVYNVAHGFEGQLNDRHQRNSISGWRHAGLPWEQC